MRLPVAAALAAVVMLVAGCQDTEARLANARLQAEIDSLKSRNADTSSDKLMQWLMASRGDDASGTLMELRKNIASISGDLTSGLKSLNKDVSDSSADARKRMDALEAKLDKVKDLETSLVALKSMVETLERTAKAVDPNQVLDLNKQLIAAQSDLRAEQIARQQAETRAKTAEDARVDAESKLAAANTELEQFKQGKASALPEHRKLKADHDALKAKLERTESDFKSLEELNRRLKVSNDELRDQIRRLGGTPPPEISEVTDRPGPTATSPENKDYAFTGRIALVRSGARPNTPSLVLVNIGDGEIPPEKSELLVLDTKNEKICRLRVTQHYYENDDRTKRVNQLGCQTIDEIPAKPVAVNDKVVWVKADASSSKPASAGGN